MAPMTRSGRPTSIPLAMSEGLRPPKEKYRETSWQYVNRPDTTRELSADPASSYGEDMMSGDEEDGYQGRQHQLEGPEDHEDILHPLREAANRVGREVEKFAEVLDGYNPLRVDDMEDRHARTVDLIDKYYTIAKDTSSRLREQHQAERRKKDGKAWRKKMRGMKIAQDTDEFDSDESDSEHLPQRSGQTTVRDMERWEQEAQTWNLLARLVQLRYPQPGTVRGNNTDKPVNQYSTEKELWSNFLATDEIAVERKTVLEWLKSTAEESGEDIDDLVQELQHNANRGDMIAAGWLHTKMAIKGVKRSIGAQESIDSASSAMKNASRTELLVTQLDPDAVSRQGRRLEAEDQYFERAVWLGCYAMLRRGRSLDDIREWCIERSQVWRAVSMAGLPDGQSEEDNGEGIDPQSWPLWRRMCYALAHNEEGDDYERAVYGILSGDIASVEPVCRSLDDFLFANYNALLRTQFDQYLQTIYSSGSVPAAVGAFGISDAVQQHGEPRSAGKRLIELLTNDPRTKTEMLQPMKMLQGVLIANDFQSFIHQQGLALSKFANATSRSNLIPAETIEPENLEKYIDDQDHDSLRVFTHVLLVFMSLDVNLGGIWKRTAVENVIVSYVTFLRLSGKEELIPLYCSQLSGTRRYAALARSLIDITDQEQRVTQIRLIRELGLDVQEFVRKQSQFLFQDFSDTVNDYPATKSFKLLRNGEDGRREIIPDFFGEEVEIDRPDLLLIRSLEWYLLIDGLWSETFLIGTLLHSRFFKHGRLRAALILAGKVSSNDIIAHKSQALLGQRYDSFDALENETDEDLTEILDGSADEKRQLKAYMLSQAENYRDLEALVSTLDNIETANSLDSLIRETTEYQESKGYKAGLSQVMKVCPVKIPKLLNGWLLTAPDDNAMAEFTLLREAYLPETILAYIHVLEFSGKRLTRDFLLMCMDLSVEIAKEGSDVLLLFEKTGRMQELVQAFALASKQLLILSSDKKSAGSRSKKLRSKGWTHDLWSIKA